MKKYILIITLIVINLLFYIKNSNIESVSKVNLKLDKNELGVIFYNTEFSDFIILNKDNSNIMFLINYSDVNELQEHIYNSKYNLNYIIMNENYDISILHKKVVKNKLTLGNIQFNYKKIKYNNKTICINKEDKCDYTYITTDNDNELLVYENKKIKDKYIIENDSYRTIQIK